MKANAPWIKSYKRFPSFQKIQDYVCSATKTEMFHERLNESILQIQQHLMAGYTKQYQVGLDKLQKTIAQLDETLLNALDALGIKEVPAVLKLPAIELDYSETPNETLPFRTA